MKCTGDIDDPPDNRECLRAGYHVCGLDDPMNPGINGGGQPQKSDSIIKLIERARYDIVHYSSLNNPVQCLDVVRERLTRSTANAPVGGNLKQVLETVLNNDENVPLFSNVPRLADQLIAAIQEETLKVAPKAFDLVDAAANNAYEVVRLLENNNNVPVYSAKACITIINSLLDVIHELTGWEKPGA